MASQLRLKQIMLAASLMLSSALQAWSPSDLLKYVPSMPSISRFFTRSASTDTPVLTAEQIDAARIAALTNGQTVATTSTAATTENRDSVVIVPESLDEATRLHLLYLEICDQYEKAMTHIQGMVLPKLQDCSQDFIQERQSIEWQITTGDVQGLNELTEKFCQSLATVSVCGQEMPVQSDYIRRAAVEKLDILLSALSGYCMIHIGRYAYVDCRYADSVKVDLALLAIKISNVLISLRADMTVPTAASAIVVDQADVDRALHHELSKQDQKVMDHLKTLQLSKAFYQEECNKARQSFEAFIIAGNVQELNKLFEEYCQKLQAFTIDGKIIAQQSPNIRRAAVEKLNFLLNALSAYCVIHIAHYEPMNAYVDCRHPDSVKVDLALLAIKISNVLLSLKADLTIPAKASPTVSLSATLLSKKVVGAAVVTGVAAVATKTEAGRSAVAGFAANVWNPAYNAVTNAAASVDYAALGNRGLALVQNNQLSLGAAAATAAVAGAAYKFWPAKSVESKEVKMVTVIEYATAFKTHITKLAEQDIASLEKGDKASAKSVVALPTSIDVDNEFHKAFLVQRIVTPLVKAYAEAKKQGILAPYRTALATVQNELRNIIAVRQAYELDTMRRLVGEYDEDAEFNNNNQ